MPKANITGKCDYQINIPTLSIKDLCIVEGDSFKDTFAFYEKGTTKVIPLPEGTTGYFKAQYGYHGNIAIMSELTIDSVNNTASVDVSPQDTNGLGSNFLNAVIYKYSMTFTLPSNDVQTLQMGNLVVLSNVLPQTAPQE